MMPPAMAQRAVVLPSIHAWDQDSDLGGPAHFHEGPNGTGDLKDYKVSDHRPIYAVFDF